tara:strand:+ start:2368 stop:2928 length:561 start_codon:yes stop_codon:yes gene_type:complete
LNKYITILSLFLIISCSKNKIEKSNIKNYLGVTELELNKIKEDSIHNKLKLNYNIVNLTALDTLGNKINIKSLFNYVDGKIIKFSYTECSYCIEIIIKTIQNNNQLSKENIIFLGHFYNQEDFILFKKINKIKFQIYRIIENDINLPLDLLNRPYIFKVTDKHVIKDFFLPKKTEPKKIINYFIDN